MSDKELLGMAAKAAGMQVDGLACKAIVQMDDEMALLIRNSAGGNSIWNPLRDDGDALRLAVKLDMDLWLGCGVSAAVNGTNHGPVEFNEPQAGDRFAATRRAIVRAAAEIGRTLP